MSPIAWAKAGYVGYSKARPKTVSMQGHPEVVSKALDELMAMAKVDKSKTGVLGFSRGGLLALHLATQRPQDIDAVVLMAPAPGKGMMDKVLKQIGKVSCPVLLLVAANDNTKDDLVTQVNQVEQALKSAGKQTKKIIYPPFGSDGHKLFFEVGSYWPDVASFLGPLL